MRATKIGTIRVHGSVAWCVAAVALMLMVAGCTDNYGQFVRSAEVTHAFRNGDYQPDYQYYYTGRDTMPYAIIGIDRRFTVPSRYWVKVEPQSETFGKMSGNMYGANHYYPSGSHIIDTAGTTIGVWYSSIHFYSVKVDQEERTVEVLFNNPENRRSR